MPFIAKLTTALTIVVAIAATVGIVLALLPSKAESHPVAPGNPAQPGNEGKLLWSQETQIHTPLAVYGTMLYGNGYEDGKHYLYADDLATGKLRLRWRFQTGGPVAKPSVSDGVVYVGSEDNFIYALREDTGELIWRFRTAGDVITTPTPFNDAVFVGVDNCIYALTADTGDILWDYELEQSHYKFVSPAVYNGVVYAMAAYQPHSNHKLLALNADYGTPIWGETEQYQSHGFYVAVFDGIVYTGRLAFDAVTGNQLWSRALDSGVSTSGGVTYGTYSSTSYAIDTAIGELLWEYRAPTGGGTCSPPVVSRGIVYAAFNDYLYAVDADTSALFWRTPTGSGACKFSMVGGVAYVWSHNHVYAISTSETPPPTPTPTRTPRPPTATPTSTPRPTATRAPTSTPAPTWTPAPAGTPQPTVTPTPRPGATATPRPTPGRGEPIISFHASQTEIVTGSPVTLTLSVVNSIGKPEMTLQFILQLPSGWSVTGEGIDESCSVQCVANYKVPSGENRDFRLEAVPSQTGQFRIDSRMEWYYGNAQLQLASKFESLMLNVAERVAPDVPVNLHATQTQVELGQTIELNLSAANSIVNPEMTLLLVLKVPSGWSVSGTGFAESCSGQCIATYKVPSGQQKPVTIFALPNQTGAFTVVGDLEWYFGDDAETVGRKSISLPLNVVDAPPPTAAPAPTPAPAAVAPSGSGGGGGCIAPSGSNGGGDLAMLGLLAIPVLGGIAIGVRSKKTQRCGRAADPGSRTNSH